MKRLSIRFRITLWFTLALVIVVLFTYLAILSINRQVLQKTLRDTLIVTVENNVSEIEFYSNIDHIDLNNEPDYFIQFHDGYLEIDDNFLDESNEVYTALYNTEASLIYGENPISQSASDIKFIDSKLQQTNVNGTAYYIFDRKLTLKGLEGLWLRGIVSEEQSSIHLSDITRLSLVLLPLLVLLAALGGYLLARKLLKPIQDISNAASQIGKGGDLKKRIALGEGTDELHQLAQSFNSMFARLDEAFETERRFTSDASHELRTPVSVIMAQCEFSLGEARSCAEYEHALQVIQRQSRKMSRLINDMLDFTRLETRADSYVRKPIDMTGLVQSVCFDMALIQENGITLEYETEDEISFTGNCELLTRLLTNLIVNAYRYGKENGHILVSLKHVGASISLSVSDDGTGIAKDEQQKIFRRFYRIDNSRSGSGTGLGLSMVYEITQFHGGEIQVESEPGKGSTFILLLPYENPDSF